VLILDFQRVPGGPTALPRQCQLEPEGPAALLLDSWWEPGGPTTLPQQNQQEPGARWRRLNNSSRRQVAGIKTGRHLLLEARLTSGAALETEGEEALTSKERVNTRQHGN
jgi:hypothetical protein